MELIMASNTETSPLAEEAQDAALVEEIRPYMIEDGGDQEWYVCVMGTRAFRDLSADPEMSTANLDARPRENDPLKTNPIFTGSHLQKDGIIYREIPEI